MLSLTIDGVPSLSSIAGVVTDATSTPTSVNFGTLTLDEEKEVAQRITIDSNATEGYRVLKFASSQLTNSYGDTLSPVSGTNATPLSWAIACDSGAASCVGYHTTDATLSGGQTARFAGDDTYAALDTESNEVIYSSIPVSTVHDIVYRAKAGFGQTAGVYESSITYIVVPIH